MGRRDVAFDQDLPVPRGLPDSTVTKLNDQHAYLRLRTDGARRDRRLGRVRHLASVHGVRQVADDPGARRRQPGHRIDPHVLLIGAEVDEWRDLLERISPRRTFRRSVHLSACRGGCRGCVRTPAAARRASGAGRTAHGVCRSGSSSGAVCPVATTTTSSPAKPSTSSRIRLHQAVDQAREAEHRAGLHAFDGVLADDRPRPGQLDATQRGRARGGRIRGHLHAGRDRTAEELALGRHHVDADRRAEVDDDRRRTELAEMPPGS